MERKGEILRLGKLFVVETRGNMCLEKFDESITFVSYLTMDHWNSIN